MDPLSIVAFAATVLEIGVRVSGHLNHVIVTWTTAEPVILALANEVSDLNVVLDHMSHTWQTVSDIQGKKLSDNSFLTAFKTALTQADNLLVELERVVIDVGSLSKQRRNYKWLKKSSVAKDLQEKLRAVRMRVTELLLAHNVATVSRIELQISQVQSAIEHGHSELSLSLVQPQKALTLRIEEMIAETQKMALTRGGFKPHEVGNSVQPKSGSPESGSIVFRPVQFTARSWRHSCRSQCRCRCHTGGLRSFRFATNYLGRLFIGYNGVPGLPRACNLNTCRRHASIEVTYTFPHWFFFGSVTAVFSANAMGTPSAGLFLAKRTPWEAGCIHLAAYSGDLELVKAHVARDPSSVNYLTAGGGCPLQFAVDYQHFDIIKFLVDHGADPDLENDFSITSRQIFAQMLLNPRRTDPAWPMSRIVTIMDCGAFIDDLPIITKAVAGLVALDASSVLEKLNPAAAQEMLNSPNSIGRAPLHWAVAKRDLKAVRAMLKAGADPNLKDRYGGRPPLFQVVNAGQQARHPDSDLIFDELVRAGADVNMQLPLGHGLFHGACQAGDVKYVQKMVSTGVDPNVVTFETGSNGKNRITAALCASQGNSIDVLRYLFEEGADINSPCNDELGDTPLMNSISTNAHECFEFLLDIGANYMTLMAGMNILHWVAKVGDAETMDIVSKAAQEHSLLGLDMAHKSRGGLTPTEEFEEREVEDIELRKAWQRVVNSIDEMNYGASLNETTNDGSDGGMCHGDSKGYFSDRDTISLDDVDSDGEDEFYDVEESVDPLER